MIYEIERKLKPCPFCKTESIGATGLYISNLTADDCAEGGQHGCSVTCDCCQCNGPWFEYGKVDEAIDGWNARSAAAFDSVG